MKLFSVIVALSVFSSCAELRQGWVKVDFVEGGVCEYCACKVTSKSGELSAQCMEMETMLKEMGARAKQRSRDQGDL